MICLSHTLKDIPSNESFWSLAFCIWATQLIVHKFICIYYSVFVQPRNLWLPLRVFRLSEWAFCTCETLTILTRQHHSSSILDNNCRNPSLFFSSSIPDLYIYLIESLSVISNHSGWYRAIVLLNPYFPISQDYCMFSVNYWKNFGSLETLFPHIEYLN